MRAHADWALDPAKIGIMGFSAGAELAAPAARYFGEFDRTNAAPSDPLAGVSSRPDFVGIIYPGPTPFARGGTPSIPRTTPPPSSRAPGPGSRPRPSGPGIPGGDVAGGNPQRGMPHLW